jgi:hypothetical protein
LLRLRCRLQMLVHSLAVEAAVAVVQQAGFRSFQQDFFFEPGDRNSIWQPLRRTLVQLKFY